MGVIHSGEHDAFFSYSHADDLFYRDYIPMFQNEVLEVYKGLLGRRRMGHLIDEVDLFIDHNGLEVSGDAALRLREHVMRSHFLFIFVGEGYVQSEYCSKELEWFRERHNHNREHALDHTFILFLSRKARLAALRGPFQSLKPSIWINLFEENDAPSWPQTGGRGRNQEFDEIVRKIVEQMGMSLPQATMPEATNNHAKIVLGAVTSDLDPVRTELAGLLEAEPGLQVTCIDWAELVANRGAVLEKLALCHTFIQLFDGSEVLWQRKDPFGGHLAVQQDLAANVPHMIRWKLSAPTAHVEQDPDHLAFIAGLAPDVRDGAAQDIVNVVVNRLHPSRDKDVIARVWVESAQGDSEWVEQMRELVERVWAKKTNSMVDLTFGEADFDELRKAPQVLQNYHGIVIIDRSKQLLTLDDQTHFIDRQFARTRSKLVRSIFVLPPKTDATFRHWPPVVFRVAPEGLSVNDEEHLDKFLDGVLARATRLNIDPGVDRE